MKHLKPHSSFFVMLWHASFLALASNFMDVHTIIPAMLIKAGGNKIHLGIMTAIMLGGSSLMQLMFASFIAHKPRKKKFLLLGINLRIAALFALALLFLYSDSLTSGLLILLIFIFISQFSFSGAFANISYVDIVGKSFRGSSRKSFISTKQIVNSIGVFISALVARQLLVVMDFPGNYTLLFFLAAFLLLIASLGFWRLEEKPTEAQVKLSFLKFFAMIPSSIKSDKNLKYYLLLINSLGLGVSVLPFVIYFAKDNIGLSGIVIGNFLLLKTLGMLLAGSILLRFADRYKYRHLLILSSVLAATIPMASLVLKNSASLFQYIFFFSGVFIATFKTAVEGILLEISTDENRATYAGISGAGNILTTIFPLLAGLLINSIGFVPVFVSVSVLVSTSIIFVLKIDCAKKTA